MYKVNPVLYQNQTDKLPQIQQDYEDVKKHVDRDNKFSSNFDEEHSDFVPAIELIRLLARYNQCYWSLYTSAINWSVMYFNLARLCGLIVTCPFKYVSGYVVILTICDLTCFINFSSI